MLVEPRQEEVVHGSRVYDGRKIRHTEPMKIRGLLLLALAAFLVLVAPGLARAAVRTVTITDPQDAPAPTAGAAKNPDLKSVEIHYDNVAGTVTVVVDFYESVKNRKDDTNVTFHFGATPGPTYACVHSPDVPLATGILYVRQGVDFLQVERVDQILQSTSSALSADGLTFVATFSSRATLAGQDWRCADVASVFMSSYTTPGCNYVGCPMADTELDPVYKNAWFDGFAPVPAAPTNVAVSSASGKSIALQWQDNDTSVTGYDVLRDGQVVGTTDKTTFTLAGLSCGTTYPLSVRADTPYTHSAAIPVSAATAVCAPMAPAHVSTAAATSASVTVTWAASANATRYVVVVGSHTYRTTAKRLTVSGLHCGQHVSVTVRAVGPGGTSAPAVASARTRHC
jgi:hypothetical protein